MTKTNQDVNSLFSLFTYICDKKYKTLGYPHALSFQYLSFCSLIKVNFVILRVAICAIDQYVICARFFYAKKLFIARIEAK